MNDGTPSGNSVGVPSLIINTMKEEQEYVYDFYAQKLADIIGIPVSYLLEMRDRGLINQRAARDLMIKYDYKVLTNDPTIPRHIAVNRIATLYNLSTTLVNSVISKGFITPRYCKQCGVPIVASKYIENGGLCSTCRAKRIRL